MVDLHIMGWGFAQRKLRLDKVDALVSIGSPGSKLPEGFEKAPHRLRLEMGDIYEPKELHNARIKGLRPPCLEDVDKLVAFAGGLSGDECLLVHCQEGVSRSPAAAWILLYVLNGSGSEKESFDEILRVRPPAWPNKILMAYAEKRLGAKFLDVMNTSIGGIWLP